MSDGEATGRPDLNAPGGLPTATFTWVVYAVGLAGALVTIIATIATAVGSLTAGYILALVLGQTAAFSAVIFFGLRYFSSQIASINQSVIRLYDQIDSAQRGERTVTLTLQTARDLNDDIASLRSIPNEQELLVFVKQATRGLSRAFTDSLGIPCRVCVKQVHAEADDRPWVEATARSDRSIEADIGVKHYIDANTDFSQLQTNRAKVWFCGDITNYPGYETTSVGYPRYRSVVVWPIVTRTARDTSPDPRLVPIVAFLCLDAEAVDAFSARDHIPVGWVVADALARAFEANRSIWLE